MYTFLFFIVTFSGDIKKIKKKKYNFDVLLLCVVTVRISCDRCVLEEWDDEERRGEDCVKFEGDEVSSVNSIAKRIQ